MGDIIEGWQTVMSTSHYAGGRLSRAQVEEYERQTLKEWRSSKEDWSGLGKHISTTEHPETKTRVHSRFKLVDDLGSTQISEVKKVHYAYHGKKPPVCLARKRIKPRRNRTIEILRAEAEVMERLDHDHIIKLVGTYSIRYNELYLLVWPVAVCDLSSFLDDIEALRAVHGDREDIYRRFEALDLQTEDSSKGPSGVCNHSTFLRQIMGCITQATAHCHHRKIRHLDLKPSNILLGPGRVYLADFGIARDVEERDSTRTVGKLGTPKWQASEVTHSWTEKDEWSMKAADVFALGLVLINISAVLHHGNLSDLDGILCDLDPETRAEGLEKYQDTLAQLALASQEFRHPDEYTVAPRHILDLTKLMTSPEPKDRPSAATVDRELVELGGLEQIYHAACCKKTTRYMTDLVDTRQKVLVNRYRALQDENSRHAKRIKELEDKDYTYHLRLENEQNKHAKDVANLERLLEGERQQRKCLETQLAERLSHGARMRAGTTKSDIPSSPGLQMRYNGRTQTHPSTIRRAPNVPAPGIPTAPRSMLPRSPVPLSIPVQQPQNPHTRPGMSFAGATAASMTARETADSSPQPGLMTRRSMSNSKLPLAINPATPIRSRTHTPKLDRDLSLTDSTQTSMTSSIISRHSLGTQETSADASPAIGDYSPVLQQKNAAAAAENSRVAAPDVGLGINGYHLSDRAAQHSTKNGDAGYAFSTGALSPVLSSSAMSSPRIAKAELDFQPHARSRAMAKVPGLPTAPSWADVAKKDQKLRA